jgi:hypothetical protein
VSECEEREREWRETEREGEGESSREGDRAIERSRIQVHTFGGEILSHLRTHPPLLLGSREEGEKRRDDGEKNRVEERVRGREEGTPRKELERQRVEDRNESPKEGQRNGESSPQRNTTANQHT